jgi:hypothetical protein
MMEISIRELLAEKKLIGPGEIRRQIEVLDSRTPALGAQVVARYLVLPQRPKGTADFSEEQLVALVTRDAMIGVVTIEIETRNAKWARPQNCYSSYRTT